ncbi:DUF6082 family protein [Streptomyces sp. NPDC046853]|uniref:DUF6082 family protein n=1 Tax=Streptomyces sp. NPDC046853 TaxID=3154920 RepID=UPI0033C8A434
MIQLVAAVSLTISIFALLGVVLSLVYQSRQTRLSREESVRAYHRDLIGMAIEDSELRVCWGGDLATVPQEEARQIMFTNLIVTWWHSCYIVKDLNDEQLSLTLDIFFKGEVGRRYWLKNRAFWTDLMREANSGKSKRFVSIVDARYQHAIAASA